MKNKRNRVFIYKGIKKNFFILRNKIVALRNAKNYNEIFVEGEKIKEACTDDDEYCAYYKRMTRWQTV